METDELLCWASKYWSHHAWRRLTVKFCIVVLLCCIGLSPSSIGHIPLSIIIKYSVTRLPHHRYSLLKFPIEGLILTWRIANYTCHWLDPVSPLSTKLLLQYEFSRPSKASRKTSLPTFAILHEVSSQNHFLSSDVVDIFTLFLIGIA